MCLVEQDDRGCCAGKLCKDRCFASSFSHHTVPGGTLVISHTKCLVTEEPRHISNLAAVFSRSIRLVSPATRTVLPSLTRPLQRRPSLKTLAGLSEQNISSRRPSDMSEPTELLWVDCEVRVRQSSVITLPDGLHVTTIDDGIRSHKGLHHRVSPYTHGLTPACAVLCVCHDPDMQL